MPSSAFPSRALSLGDDYGNPQNVVRMHPGHGVPPQAAAAPAEDLGAAGLHTTRPDGSVDPDPTKVSVAEAAKGAFDKEWRAYNEKQRAQGKEVKAVKEQLRQESRAAQPIRRPASGTRGGYAYLQYPDGSIQVVATPTGQGIGTQYAAGSQAAKNVESEFGPYPATGGAKALDVFSQFMQGTAQAFVASQESKAPHEKPEKDNTWLYVGLGVGGVALLGGLAILIARSGDSKKGN